MSNIEVLEPGLLTTVQDLGREGFGPMGVSPSGAADALSLRLGNRLVGNDDNAAALEMTLLGGAFRFPQGAVIALSGSDFGASLDGAPVILWESIQVRPGQLLRLGPTRSGARCYLCVQGGIAVEPFLGSASTHLLSGLGGFAGRALRRGDVLRIGAAAASFCQRRANPNALKVLTPRKILRVTAGPQSDWFSESRTTRVLRIHLSRRRGVQSHGPAPRRQSRRPQSRTRDDYRRRFARRHPGARPAGSPSFCSSSSKPPAAIPKSPMSSPPTCTPWANSVRATKSVSSASNSRRHNRCFASRKA